MKTHVLITLGLVGTLALVASAQTIPNPSFEANSFTNYPGYISGNSQIVGWTTTDAAHAGINPVSGTNNPFSDNGVVPDGANVAFIQNGANSSLSTVLSNLTAGQTYKVNFRVNARNGNTPNLKIAIASLNLLNTAVTSVGGINAYKYVALDFTATANSPTMTLRNDAGGDHTVLLDDFSIAARNSGWSYAAWSDDATSGVDGTKTYTHAFHFGSTTGTNINGVTFTGIAGTNPSVSNSFSTFGLDNVSSDANNVTGASHQLANDFLWGGAEQRITIKGLVAGKSYVATLYSVGFENGTRAATFSAGNDRLTLNQDQFGDNNGIRVLYRFTANSNSITLTYVPLSGSTFHTYGFSNYEVPGSHVATLVVTNLADSGPGTLRQAIASAQSGDTITFGTNGIIKLTTGPLYITTDLTIVGPGPASLAVDGNLAYRVFEMGVGVTASISGITIQNGRWPNGGALGSFGTTVISNCVITGNAATASGGFGGAIHNAGVLALIACTVSNNRAGDGGGGPNGANGSGSANNGSPGGTGGPGGNGGGIYNEGALAMTACTINNNAAGNGGNGGAGGNGSQYHVFSCGNGGNGGVAGNGGSGGGVFNSATATLALTNCTIHGNAAGNGGSGGSGGVPSDTLFCDYGFGGGGGKGLDGGGIYNAASASGLALTACTLSNNRAGDGGPGGYGGTLLSNKSGAGGDGGNGGGIFDYTPSAVLTELRNTLVAQNHPGAGGPGNGGLFGGSPPGSAGVAVDLRGENFLSHGNNLVGNNDNFFVLVNQSSTDIVGTNAMLAPLGDNGGPTLTVALLTGSPGLDSGDDTLTNNLATDQRGYPRRLGAHVDIGAFETQAPVVLNANDSGDGSLRNIVFYSLPLQTITFDPSLSGQTIHLTSGQLTISKSLTINASALAGGVAIDAGGNARALEITASNIVTVDSLTVMNGRTFSGGGMLVDDSATLTVARCQVIGNSASNGGGIANHGTLTLSNSVVAGNSATNNSGGIENEGGTLTITGCRIYANSADYGGGIGSHFSNSVVAIDQSTLFSNLATNNGGGIENTNGSTLILNNSTLSGNSAGGFGGGIDNRATLKANNSTISSNSASYSGGFNNFGALSLTNTIVAGNNAGTDPNMYNDISGSFAGANNLTSGDPHLSPLGNYGGSTLTMRPLAGSPAIGAGTDSVTNILATDQRGYARLSGAHVDIGAVEVQALSAASAPMLTNPVLQAGGALSFGFVSSPDVSFTVLAATNVALPLGQWSILGAAVQYLPGQYLFTDVNATNYPRRFYRVVSP